MYKQKASTSQKCQREDAIEITPKNVRFLRSDSLNLANANSPLRIVQVMDKRFDKLTEQLKATMQSMLRECENHLLCEMDRKLNIAMSDVNNLTERVLNIETAIKDINNTVLSKIVALTNENDDLKQEILSLKKQVRHQANSIVAHDLRISGVPFVKDENLFDIYSKLCQMPNMNAPNVKAIFRVNTKRQYLQKSNNNKSKKEVTDPDIIIKFKSPYDRNFVLRSITSYLKSNKEVLRLNNIGFDSMVPFYINENLSPENHRIFQQARRLKKSKIISSAFTNRGLVFIKKNGENEPIQIDDLTALHRMFRPPQGN